MQSDKPIVVFGGTGHYGQKIVKSLVAKSVPVRVLTRNPDKAVSNFGSSVEVVYGDVLSKDCITNSLKNVSGVIISLSAINPKQIKQMHQIEQDAVISIIEEMEGMKIPRLVYISVYDLRIDLLERLNIKKLGEIKIAVESRIKTSGLNWTILGCPPSYELFFALLRGDKLVVPGGGHKKIACVSPEDIGEIAAQAILKEDLGGRRYRMAGPDAFNFTDVARMVSAYSGQKIRLVAPPLFLVNLITWLIQPFNPFPRFIYYGLKMMNNFPQDLAEKVPEDHLILLQEFDYIPVNLENEIKGRFGKPHI